MVRRIYHLTKSSVSYRLEIMLSFLTRPGRDRKSTRLNSSHLVISYAVFCLKKKKYDEISNVEKLYMIYGVRTSLISADYYPFISEISESITMLNLSNITICYDVDARVSAWE